MVLVSYAASAAIPVHVISRFETYKPLPRGGPANRMSTTLQIRPVHVDNIASEARDFCAIERTYLSHLRLGVVLTLLSASILLNARLPAPNADGDPTSDHDQLQGLRFGSLYFAAALAAFFGGLLNYDKLWSGMKNGRAFVQSPRFYTIILTLISGLIIATVIVLLVHENVALQ